MVPSLRQLGEFGLIRRIHRLLPDAPKTRWPATIGEDTSVLKLGENHFQLLTHDLLLEDVHFELSSDRDFENLGWKALAVNLSDIAAMGGVPQEAVVGLGIPAAAKTAQVEALYRGLAECSQNFHCPIVGGDTNRSRGKWVVSVTVTGYCARPPLLRSQAKPGDSLWVTGTLGGAALGFHLRNDKKASASVRAFQKRWQRPQPRILWGQRLSETGKLSSMIDVSDGLAGDVQHLSEASRVGFEIDFAKLPQDPTLEKLAKQQKLSLVELLLSGGEDYELLFTVTAGDKSSLKQRLKNSGIVMTEIGRAVRGDQLTVLSAEKKPISYQTGYQHF